MSLRSTEAAEGTTIFPWIHSPNNILRAEDAMRPVRIPDVTPSNLLSAGAMNNCAAPLAAFADVARPSRTYHVHWQATRGVLIYRWSRASLWKCTARMSVRLCADAVAPALRSVTCGVRTSCLLAGSRAAEWDAVLSCFF